jgi:hypothetical protein
VTFFPSIRPTVLQSESSTIAAKILHTIYPILPTAAHDMLDPYLKNLPATDGYLAGDNAAPANPSDKTATDKPPLDTIRDLGGAATDYLFGNREPAGSSTRPAIAPAQPRTTTRPLNTDIPQIIQDGEFLAPPELPPRSSRGRTTTETTPSKTTTPADDDLFPPLPPPRTSAGSRDRY